MRVLLVSTLERGGPVEQALVLASGLRAAGIDVDALCATPGVRARFERTGAQASELPVRHGMDLPAARALWRRMRGADVVHAQDRRAGLWTRLAPRRRPLVYTVHGLPDPYLPPPAGPDAPTLRDRLAYEGLDAALCRRADAIIVPSAAQAEVFARRLRFPRSRIRVVPNGVEMPAVPAERGRTVGTLSVLEPVKDLPTFLRAAAVLAADRPDLPFAVFGEGSQRASLEAQARDLGLGTRVRFAGHVDREAALAELRILVLPSLVETAPMALLEAMAAGIPAVAARVGGIPEIAGRGTVALVAPGDPAALATAVARLLDDPPAAAAQAAAARARVRERFSAQACATATLAVYEEAVARHA